MAMVQVGVVRVPVPERFMPVPVGMRLCRRSFVDVLMMFIVDVSVLVLDRLVRMLVAMSFGQMQPESERHKPASDDELRRHRLAE